MKIAFTSCIDVENDPVQEAWKVMTAQKPDHIVLLGDNIYMDYGLGHSLGNGEPERLNLADFSNTMHSAYAKQWTVGNFKQAIKEPTVHAIWDDHDFAWDDSRGGAPEKGADYVPADKRRLSRALFEQFRQALVKKPAAYPGNPYPDGVVAADLGGIQTTIDLAENLRLHLLDGRSYREAPHGTTSLLGDPQKSVLEQALLKEPGVNLIASSTNLEDDWLHYKDFAWLHGLSQKHRILVLSGDIHEPKFYAEGRLYEATASAMAQPAKLITGFIGKRSQVFGIAEIDAEHIVITLWRKGKARETRRIDLGSWSISS